MLNHAQHTYTPSFPLDSSSVVSSSFMSQPAVSTKMSGMLVSGVIITPGRSLINNIVSFYNSVTLCKYLKRCVATDESASRRLSYRKAEGHDIMF